MMKRLTLCAALLVACCPSLARQSATSEPDICVVISRYAEKIMEARQSNVDITKMMEIAAMAEGKVAPWKRAMILRAYEQPRYASEEYRDNAVRDFKNEAYLACMKEPESP